MEYLITPNDVRAGGFFDEEYITDDILNSTEYIPLAHIEAQAKLKEKHLNYEDFDDIQKMYYKLALINLTRSKACTLMVSIINQSFKKVDKADIKFEITGTPDSWRELSSECYINYSNYVNKILSNQGVSIDPIKIVRW